MESKLLKQTLKIPACKQLNNILKTAFENKGVDLLNSTKIFNPTSVTTLFLKKLLISEAGGSFTKGSKYRKTLFQ